MPKILPNRSSKTLTALNLENIKNHYQGIVTQLEPLVVITDDEFAALPKLGTTTKPICDKVLEVAEEEPSYLEAEQTVEEVGKDKTYNEQLESVKKLHAKIGLLLERESGVSGAEYRNAILNYEGNVKEKVKKGSKEAQLTLDKLNRIDRGTKDAPPSPAKQTVPK